MSFMSRLLKLIMSEETPEEETEEALAQSAEEGLFMSTGREPEGAPRVGEQVAEAADSDALGLADASQAEATAGPQEVTQPRAETDDELETAESSADGSAPEGPEDLEAAGQAQADAEEAKVAASGSSAAATADSAQSSADTVGGSAEQASAKGEEGSGAEDDLLSAFRNVGPVTGATELTKEIEDVPIDGLLAELREIRSMLPPTPAADGSEAGEDVAA